MDDIIKPQRIAKVIARSGYCSRREAEELISEARVQVNGKVIDNPATLITDHSIKIDGKLLKSQEAARLWVFHKPKGYVVTNMDEKNRKTIFDILPNNLPRVITIGRLDINTEGLLLLTNDGNIARYAELPENGWTRNYRVRAYGKINLERLKKLEKGIRIDNVKYGAIKVSVEKEGTANSWLKVSLNEGKNREVKKVLQYCGLTVNRLIRISFGPFHLGNLNKGDIKEVPAKTIKETFGKKL